MTQIEASPMPTGKVAAKADAGALRDRGKGGQADGDAEMEGGKPRFGDHWRSILSGDAGKPGNQQASPDEGELAGETTSLKRFGVLLRLPPVALAQAGDAAKDGAPAGGADAAKAGETDISEVLATLKGAGIDGGEVPAHVSGDVPGTRAKDANTDAITSGAITESGEGEIIGAADMQAGDTAVEQAARGAPVHPAMANAAAQSAATGTTQTAPASDTKARARGVANAPLDKGSSDTTSDIHLATRADAARPAMKATVVHQATHFAPALGAANLQAISSALTEAAGDMRQGAERTGADSTMQQPGARPTGPVKTLTIQLTPVSLGKITVEMRLVDGAMKVDIQVADPKALEMVRSDKDLIMNLLRKAGVVPDTVTIQTADNASSARQNQAGQGGASGSGFDREASREGSDGSGRNAGREDHDQGRMPHDDRSIDPSRLRGDIYL